MSDLDDIRKKYRNKISSELGLKDEVVKTQHYSEFKQSFYPKRLSYYEKLCNFSGKLLNIGVSGSKKDALQDAIRSCHLNTTPTGVTSFSYLMPLFLIFIGLLFGFMIPYGLGAAPNTFIVLMTLLVGAGAIIPLQKLPYIFSNAWRLKASNQMVLCVFYIVTYMRHTSNLELAIDFASSHLSPPLSLDLKKVLWNIETQTFSDIKESLDDYLEQWRETNMEFVEAMHLIEGSLYETDETRRLQSLDKALEVMLQETYEKMLHYAHELKNPITTLHMMGVILPIMGLVILPLATNFLGNVMWYHVFFLYNIILPLIVYYYGKSILSTRPTGYGSVDISESPTLAKKLKLGRTLIPPSALALLVFGVLFFIGFTPLMIHSANPDFDCVYAQDYSVTRPDLFCATQFEEDLKPTMSLLEYRPRLDEYGLETEDLNGPFGFGAAILSLCVTLAFGLGIGLYYKLKTKNVMKIRKDTEKLEKEFGAALFQLGNRLGDGLPAEIAFAKVAGVMRDSVSGRFFKLVASNITRGGLGLEDAIFSEENGALKQYPSDLIESSMKVLIESSKKGPLVASQALINVSEYIREMHRVDERLKDLMGDIVGSMKSQISFLAPSIAGIVVGITSLITKIMIVLASKMTEMGKQSPDSQYGSILSMLGGGNAIPTFHFQIIVGLYVVQIVYCLTIMVNGIENGNDKLAEKYNLGTNMVRSTLSYVLITLVVMLIFSSVTNSIIQQIG